MKFVKCRVPGRETADIWINLANVTLVQKAGQGFSVTFVGGQSHQLADLPDEVFRDVLIG